MNTTITKTQHSRKALVLSYFTVAYNILEGVVAVVAGLGSGSISLLGFGLDSFIESLSGSVMIWRFTNSEKIAHEDEEKVETKAATLVAYTFFILAAYVAYEAIQGLISREEPLVSPLGIGIAVVSILVMPTLFLLKNRTGRALNSRSLIADSKQTLMCVLLSATLLIGLLLNYWLQWWWADSATALIIAALLFREGYETYRKRELCDC